jgi:hypothetical protein
MSAASPGMSRRSVAVFFRRGRFSSRHPTRCLRACAGPTMSRTFPATDGHARRPRRTRACVASCARGLAAVLGARRRGLSRSERVRRSDHHDRDESGCACRRRCARCVARCRCRRRAPATYPHGRGGVCTRPRGDERPSGPWRSPRTAPSSPGATSTARSQSLCRPTVCCAGVRRVRAAVTAWVRRRSPSRPTVKRSRRSCAVTTTAPTRTPRSGSTRGASNGPVVCSHAAMSG